jgi:hypothetical protein
VFWRVLTFVALWLTFECVISWLAFCDPVGQHAAHYQAHQEHCSAFRGPVLASTFFLVSWIAHSIHEYGEAVTAAFTVVLAISTILLWRSTDKLWQAGERQMELIAASGSQQSRDMQASIKVAQNAAKAAAKSADTAERGVVAADRAWIKIDVAPVGNLIFGEEKIELRVKITFKNVGRSPATNVTQNMEMLADAGEAANKADDWTRRGHYLTGLISLGFVLFPEQEFSFEVTLATPTAGFVARIADLNETEIEGGPHEPITDDAPAIAVAVYYGLPSAGRTGGARMTTEVFDIRGADPEHVYFDGSERGEFRVEISRTAFAGSTS